MKRLDKCERIQLKRGHQLAPLRSKRRQARDEKLKRRQMRRLIDQRVQSLGTRHFSSKKIVLPTTLSLATSSDRNLLVDALTNLRSFVAADNVSSVVIDFSKVEILHPCGTILLVAEIERLLEDSRYGIKLKATYPECEVVEQLFQYISILEKLGCPPRVEIIDSQDVVVWLYESGVEGNLDAIVGNLPALLTSGSNMALRMAVNSGMAEAVANSSEHAYIFERADGLDIDSPTKWWLFAKKEDDDISLVICDLGVGIPGSLPRTWTEDVEAFAKTMIGKKREDHQLIKFAMKLGRSRTNLVHRGQGLKDILKVVKKQKVGRLGIYSNCGVYNFDGPTGYTFGCSEPTSILGTVVQWRVPVAAFNQVVQEGIDE
ncbi:hypothetical protein [Pseudomonas fluorescens]|uniref:hypothetical protein n=1 Tax=Pseudomonas fluorescens TaxID=294 RepID=UPI0011C073BF|nr:hypothetical protein [Pseudomonas fluorescens]